MSKLELGFDRMLALLGVDFRRGLSIADAAALAGAHHPPFGPDAGALLIGFQPGALAARIQQVLLNQYAPEFLLQVVIRDGEGASLKELQLYELDRLGVDTPAIALYVPPLPAAASFEALQETVAHLRAPEGCPWDREQTPRSLRRHLLEEAYEALEALDRDDPDALREELGDLLLQILLQAQIATESGAFRAADVVAGIQSKLIRRHPHVFGDLEVSEVDQVLKNWEHYKEAEKGNGLLDGVPASLPALAQAEELQGRAARVGFDWPRIEGVLAKIEEEIGEIQRAADAEQQARELGDLLFAIVNYARWTGADAEAALRAANLRFRERFSRMSSSVRAAGLRLDQLGIEELDRLWEAAKRETN